MTVARCIAEGLAFPESPIAAADGSVVVSEMAAGRITRVDPQGSTSMVATTGGGPNGVGLLPGGGLVVCQNGGSRFGIGPWPYDFEGAATLFRPVGPPDEPVVPSLQRVAADGTVSTLATEFTTRAGDRRTLVRPSDVCVDADGGFYITDGGTTRGRSRTMTGLLYGTLDGDVREVVFPLEMPNGVALSPDGAQLYVAETRTRRIWEFTLAGPGTVAAGRGLATVPGGGPLGIGGADGLCVAADGTILAATLGQGGVTAIAPDGELLGAIPADDPMTTNVTLSPNGRNLYLTLASSGRLMVIERWRTLAGIGDTATQ